VSELYDEIQLVRKHYPEGTHSAVLPALRLAQEKYGWLPREAFEEVADALDVTPAYCMSVASFYDMFHLQPVGRHMVEVCTNVCCGLVNAQAVLEAFEQELGVGPGETTATARSRRAPWSASAAAAHRRSSPSITATASPSRPGTCR